MPWRRTHPKNRPDARQTPTAEAMPTTRQHCPMPKRRGFTVRFKLFEGGIKLPLQVFERESHPAYFSHVARRSVASRISSKEPA